MAIARIVRVRLTSQPRRLSTSNHSLRAKWVAERGPRSSLVGTQRANGLLRPRLRGETTFGRTATKIATEILPSEVAMHKVTFAAVNRPLSRLTVSKSDFLVHDAWPLALEEINSS